MAVLTCQESALIFFSSCHHRKNILVVLGKIEKRKGFHNLYIHIQNTLCYQKRCIKIKILIWETRPTPISAVYCTQCLVLYYTNFFQYSLSILSRLCFVVIYIQQTRPCFNGPLKIVEICPPPFLVGFFLFAWCNIGKN